MQTCPSRCASWPMNRARFIPTPMTMPHNAPTPRTKTASITPRRLRRMGAPSKVFVIFWATLFPILPAILGSVRQVDQKLIEMARSYGATHLQVYRRVISSASVPAIFARPRLSATTVLLLPIVAELIGANKGAGFQVMNAQYNFQIALMFAAIFLLAFLDLASNGALVALQRRVCRWLETDRRNNLIFQQQ